MWDIVDYLVLKSTRIHVSKGFFDILENKLSSNFERKLLFSPSPSHFKFFKGCPPQIVLDLIYDKIFHNSQNLSKMLENLNIAKL